MSTITMTVGQKTKGTITGNGTISGIQRTGAGSNISIGPDPSDPTNELKFEVTAVAVGTCYVTTFANNNTVSTQDTFVVNPSAQATTISISYTTPA